MSTDLEEKVIEEGWRNFVQHLDADSQERVLRILRSENLYQGLTLIEGLATGYKAVGVIGRCMIAVVTKVRQALLFIVSLGVIYVAFKAWSQGEISFSEALRWLVK